jgi:peptidoglycan hydrolase-like protein with peptidoglycan-binding domain
MRSGSTLVIDLGDAAGALEMELDSESQPLLREGSQGSPVRALQACLAALGYSPGPIDGYFGALTAAAVRAFQSARRLLVDGIVGSQTWAALNAQATPAPTRPAPAPWPSAGSNRRAINLRVPFYGYQSNDATGCFHRCTEMAAAVGVRVGGPDVRIQVALREDSQGRVTIDPQKAREGLAYVDARLEAGDPVVVGVSYMDSDYNVDAITDHFVIITRRNTDPTQGLCYGYHDPARSQVAYGGDQHSANRFFLTPEGGLFRPRPTTSDAPMSTKTYDVSMVRRNL